MMRVLLSTAVGPHDGPLAERIRVFATAYPVAVDVPRRALGPPPPPGRPSRTVRAQIGAASALLALVTTDPPAEAHWFQPARPIIDERRGYGRADRMSLHPIRTGALLVDLKLGGLIPEVRPVLDRLVRLGMWISDDVRAELLTRAGED